MSIKPARLRSGDEIAVIAPAGPVSPSEIQPAVNMLVKEGFRVIEAPHLFSRQGYLAGGDDSRLEDFHSAFANTDIKAVFCARGGYGTLRLLDRIDYTLITRNPKIIIGYSDITALLLAIHKRTDLITFHGPIIKELHRNRMNDMKAFLDLVSLQKNLEMDLSRATSLAGGRAEGILLGGNLSLISHVMGTPFMPPVKGAILFIEEKGEPLYRIDRMLTHLRLCGVFDDIKGLMVGRFMDCGNIQDLDNLLMDIMAGRSIPICSGLPVGHGMNNMTLPIGLSVDLDTRKMTLSASDTCVTS